MKHFPVLLFVFISLFSANNSLVYSQNSETAAVFKAVVSHYYKNEKPVYKNRGQLLYLYCTQAKPNEELVEAVKTANLPADFTQEIRAKIKSNSPEKDWSYEWKQLPKKDESLLKKKINGCVTLAKFQEIRNRLQLNNQRLLIITEPLFYSKQKLVLVKVVFYRTIEHNSGAILLLENTDGNWQVLKSINEWST